MSDFYDDEDGNESALVKDLRNQLKAKDKEISTLQAENATFKTQTRQRTLQEVLTSKGVNAKVAALIPSDVEGEEAVTKWLDDYADLFGVAAKPAVDEDDLAAMKKAQEATATGGGASPSQLAAEEKYLDEAQTPEEWMQRAKALKGGVPLDPNL